MTDRGMNDTCFPEIQLTQQCWRQVIIFPSDHHKIP